MYRIKIIEGASENNGRMELQLLVWNEPEGRTVKPRSAVCIGIQMLVTWPIQAQKFSF